jgi:hypothetical protein
MIQNGVALASIAPEVYESDVSLQQQLHQFLDARLKVREYLTGDHYELRSGCLTEHHSDGRKTRHLTVLSAKIDVAGVTPYPKISDCSGRTLGMIENKAARSRACAFQNSSCAAFVV